MRCWRWLLPACLLGALPLLSAACSNLGTAGGDELLKAKQEFLKHHGDDYGYGNAESFDQLWAQEVGSRLPEGQHYIDFTGSSLYWNSQLEASLKELEHSVFGNPHSNNPSSLHTEQLVEELRLQLLRFLGADPEQYDLVFTRSGTGALHTLGETFPWSADSRFAYLTSNHNSVLGIREYAHRSGAAYGAVQEEELEKWLAGSTPLSGDGSREGAGSGSAGELPPILQDLEARQLLGQQPAVAVLTEAEQEGRQGGARRQLRAKLPDQAALGSASASAAASSRRDAEPPDVAAGALENGKPTFSLFAYPAYDNFAGVMYPLRWVKAIRAKSTSQHQWKVLLDAAAFLPSHPLNLTEVPADYVCISFYKLFGYPTGVGAWVVRRDAAQEARKEYWGGGSVFLATSTLDWKHFKPVGNERFEDGTLPFLNIIALKQGLQVYESLGGQAAIERHTAAIAAWLYGELSQLKHSNGAPLLRIFGRHDWPNSHEVQGSTFNFQILMPDGQLFSYRQAAIVLAEAGFHMRCGCTCNPGACYGFLGVRDEEVRAAAKRARGNFSDWEWVWVRRKDGKKAAPTAAAGTVANGGPEVRLGAPPADLEWNWQWLKLPLGSLRASFGYMSRFEDAYALLSFLKSHYTDRTSDDGHLSALGAPAAAAAGKAARLRWAEVQDPGWC